MKAPPLDTSHLVAAPSVRVVTWRSVLLGLIGVLFICGLTPYNDYAVANTYLVGNFLPVGLLLFISLLVMLINAPLSRFAPRFALSSGELAVALSMTMVSCAIPSSGLMRYLPGHLVGIWHYAGSNGEFRSVLSEINPPDWLFPTPEYVTRAEEEGLPEAPFTGPMTDAEILARANDPVVQNFWGRIPLEDDSFIARFRAVPWKAWLTPAIAWGVFIFAMFGAVLCLMVILRRQWVENERLAFPLATIYLSLIESPPPGRALNGLFRSTSFWIAFGVVFCIHGLNAMYKYDPLWPEMPIDYDIGKLLSERPWVLLPTGYRRGVIYFVIIGITFFLQTQIAFSLWFFYILFGILCMLYGMADQTFSDSMQRDQTFGGIVPFVIALLWVGRQHWMVVIRQMFGRARPADARGRYLPYFMAGWGFVLCLCVMVAWLFTAGTTLVGAVLIITLMMTVFLVIARIVAETGLPYVQVATEMHTPWIYAASVSPTIRTSMGTHFFSSMLTTIFTNDSREALAPYAANSLRVADSAAYEGVSSWRRAIPFTICLGLALVVGYFTAGGSMLYVEYSNAVTLDKDQTLINSWAMNQALPNNTIGRIQSFKPPSNGPREAHTQLAHVGTGAAITTALSVLRLNFAWWPLHPIGFLMAYSAPMQRIWLSVFIGWILKVLIVRFGGANMFRSARPLFIGMIMGEAAAAAFWLVVSLVRNFNGLPYERIMLLPG